MKLCAVTGAGGYVGSRFLAGAHAQGWSVRSLGRRSAADAEEHRGFTLAEGPEPGGLDGVGALVHCAWDFGARTRAEIERVNVDGSRRLLDAAAAAGVERIVFVSTLSAFPGARSLYGRAKLAVEEHARALGAIVVRPGVVWGPTGGSMYGSLRRLATRAPVVPVFSDRALHLAHEDDLAQLAGRLLADDPPASGETIVAASPEPLSLAEILQRIAQAEGRRLRIVRVPWRMVWLPLRVLEAGGLRPPFRSDSVVSLVSLDEQPFDRGAAPPVPFRPFAPFAA